MTPFNAGLTYLVIFYLSIFLDLLFFHIVIVILATDFKSISFFCFVSITELLEMQDALLYRQWKQCHSARMNCCIFVVVEGKARTPTSKWIKTILNLFASFYFLFFWIVSLPFTMHFAHETYEHELIIEYPGVVYRSWRVQYILRNAILAWKQPIVWYFIHGHPKWTLTWFDAIELHIVNPHWMRYNRPTPNRCWEF